MGWKNVKEGYQIQHLVCVTPDGICIGSGFIHDLIVIGLDGVVKKRFDGSSNDDLRRYQQEMDADPMRLAQLVKSPDHFDTSITVYTYDGGDIIEKKCEAPGWPNVTHDGDMMYNNTYSSNRAEVVEWAKRNADAGIKIFERNIEETKTSLAELEALLAKTKGERAKLELA